MLESIKFLRYFSDLHLDRDVSKNFNGSQLWMPLELPTDKETVLILAGDIWEAKKFLMFSQYSWIKEVSKKFKYVVGVLGNHDYYGGCLGPKEFHRIDLFLKENEIKNVFFLNNESIEFENLFIAGTTLWTNLRNSSSLLRQYIQQGFPDEEVKGRVFFLNDFKYIKTATYQKLRAVKWLEEHFKSVDFLRNQTKPNKPFVVVSHHAPLLESLKVSNQNEPENSSKWLFSGLYASDLSNLISEISPDLWIHGHVHEVKNYLKGSTRVLVNPRGYANREVIANFDPLALIEIESLKNA